MGDDQRQYFWRLHEPSTIVRLSLPFKILEPPFIWSLPAAYDSR